MKKLLTSVFAIALLFAFTVPAMAFLDYTDESINNDARTEATYEGNTFEGSKIPRGFAMAPEYHYPGLIGYSGPATPGPRYRDAKQLLLYADTWTVQQLQDVALGSGLLKKHEMVTDEKLLAKKIKFVVAKVEGVTLLSFGTTKSGKKADSVDVLAMAGVTAAKRGADIVHINAQGVSRELKSLGWGVGLAFSRASINADETAGSVGGGGTGVAGATAKIDDGPWMQWTALKNK